MAPKPKKPLEFSEKSDTLGKLIRPSTMPSEARI
jgi:hypothetical protein